MLSQRDSLASWKRLVTRAFQVFEAGLRMAVIEQLQSLTARELRRVVLENLDNFVTKEEIMMRTPLPRTAACSRAAPKELDAHLCAHSTLIRRANQKAAWWQCSDCLTRWPRDKLEKLLA